MVRSFPPSPSLRRPSSRSHIEPGSFVPRLGPLVVDHPRSELRAPCDPASGLFFPSPFVCGGAALGSSVHPWLHRIEPGRGAARFRMLPVQATSPDASSTRLRPAFGGQARDHRVRARLELLPGGNIAFARGSWTPKFLMFARVHAAARNRARGSTPATDPVPRSR